MGPFIHFFIFEKSGWNFILLSEKKYLSFSKETGIMGNSEVSFVQQYKL